MILFLDFDGVLHPLQLHEPDFCRLPLLWEILRACPDVEVVFSTSWRAIYRFDEMVGFVTRGGGEDLAHRIIGVNRAPCPIQGGRPCRRHYDCIKWLEDNGHEDRSWLALDDIASSFVPSPPAAIQRLYLVDGTRGLTNEDVLAIIGRIQSD